MLWAPFSPYVARNARGKNESPSQRESRQGTDAFRLAITEHHCEVERHSRVVIRSR